MYVWITALFLVLDQAIKAYVRTIPTGQTFFTIPGFLSLTHCVNTGAAFSILSGKTLFLAMLSVFLLGTIYVFVCREMRLTAPARLALSCMIGGGVGNLLDRVLFGGVTDYVRLLFVSFPVFNLADIGITVAIAVLMVMLLTDTLEESSEEKHGSDS